MHGLIVHRCGRKGRRTTNKGTPLSNSRWVCHVLDRTAKRLLLFGAEAG